MKYILSHNAAEKADASQEHLRLTEILQCNGAHVIDGSMLPKLATIEVSNKDVPALKESLGEDWSLYQEKQYRLPTTKPRLAKTGT
jgi:hypothetical protein